MDSGGEPHSDGAAEPATGADPAAALIAFAGLPAEAPLSLAVDLISEREPEAQDHEALQGLIRSLLMAASLDGVRDRWGVVERLAFALARVGSPEAVARSRLDRALVNLARGERRRVSRALHEVAASKALTAADQACALAGLVSLAVLERDLPLSARLAQTWLERARASSDPGLIERAASSREALAWLIGKCHSGVKAEAGAGAEVASALPEALFGFAEPTQSPARAALSSLMAWRRRMDDPAWQENVMAKGLREALAVCSQWNLAGPSRSLESLLRERDPASLNEALLARHLGATVAGLVTGGQAEPEGAPELSRVTLLMLDIQGYSRFCELSDPRDVFATLTPLYKVLNDELKGLGGWIHEFVGDGLMAVIPHAHDDAGAKAGSSAAKLLRGLERVLDRARNISALLSLEGRPFLRFGMALHAGPVATGLLGSRERSHFAVLGHTTNVTARLERLTRRQSRPLIVSLSALGGIVPEEGGLPDFWRRPEDFRLSVRDPGSLPLKGLRESPPVLAFDTLIRYGIDFLPMGAVVSPEPGVIVLDTGGALGPGIIDSHAARGSDGPRSSCRCLIEHPEWLLEHEGVRERIEAGAAETLELRLHRAPDLDCCATLTAAYELLGGDPRQDRLAELADYVDAIDSGAIPDPAQLGRSLYGVFLAHVNRVYRQSPGVSNMALLEAGLRVVDAALFLADRMAARGDSPDLASIFTDAPAWFPEEQALIAEDMELYRRDRAAGSILPARVRQRLDVGFLEVTALWLERPQSLFFKHWARGDPEAPGGRGFGCLAVDWSEGEQRRFVISVAPDGPTDLRGLAGALDQAEDELRAARGRPRPRSPRRPPTELADPWYGGWGHDHTIVDAPRSGTWLSADRVKELLGQWRPPGGPE